MVEFKLMFTVVAAIVFVFIFVESYVFINSQIKELNSRMDTVSEDLEIIDIAHTIKKCLGKANGLILKDFLDKNEGRNMCDICEICNVNTKVILEDIETWDWDEKKYKNWTFGELEEKYHSHSIFVNIKENDKIHVGRLYVET